MTKKIRSEFRKSTITKLAKRAAYHCSNCLISTLSASELDEEGYSHTGQAAHIFPASLNGPRANVSVTFEEKTSIKNGIYLCQICAKLIDANRGTDYPPERLQQIKENHEKSTRTGAIPMSPERFAKIVGFNNSKSTSTSRNKPDLALRFIYPESPALVLINRSSVIAKDIKWTVAIWNMDLPERNDPLPIPIGIYDWIRPNDEGGPQNIFDTPSVKSILTPGNRLLGQFRFVRLIAFKEELILYTLYGENRVGLQKWKEKNRGILLFHPVS